MDPSHLMVSSKDYFDGCGSSSHLAFGALVLILREGKGKNGEQKKRKEKEKRTERKGMG